VSNQVSTQGPGAKEQALEVAEDARQEASAVVSEASTQARNVADQTRHALRSQAHQGADRAAGALDDLSSQLRGLAQGHPEQAGELRRYAGEAAERVQRAAQHVNERGFDGLVDDMQSFARRRPGVFLAAAAATGFVAGRLFRGAQAASGDTSGTGHGGNGHRGQTALPPEARTTPSTPPATPAPPTTQDPQTTGVLVEPEGAAEPTPTGEGVEPGFGGYEGRTEPGELR
jgi:hypothetical protein